MSKNNNIPMPRTSFMKRALKLFARNADNHASLPMGSGVNVWGSAEWFRSPLVGKYSDTYFYTITNKIFSALHNCRFVDNSDTESVTELCRFLEREIVHIVWNYWKNGIIVCEENKDGWLIIDHYKTDKEGLVEVPSKKNWIIVYSDLYKVKRLSTFEVIQSELGYMDRIGSAEDFLTSTYGCVNLITGTTMPMSVAEKEELNKQLKTSLGTTADKDQFVISQAKDLSVNHIDFDVKGLGLDEKMKREYLLLADFFNVPKNILSSDTDSTYENQRAALRRFYSDCISPLCEVVLELGRAIIVQGADLVPASSLTFTFDNVPEISSEAEFVSEVKALLEIVADTNLDGISARKIREIINKKIEDYQ